MVKKGTNKRGIFIETLFILALFFAGLTSCEFAGASDADPLDNWYWRNPISLNANLFGVAYGNGFWVVVGAAGTILTSPDGIHWTIISPIDTGINENLTRR